MKDNKGKSKIFYGWWIVLGGTITMAFATPMVTSLNSLYVVPITEGMGISRSAFMVTSLLTSISAIVSSAWSGRYMKKQNTVKIQLIATLIFGLSYASYAFAQHVMHLYISAIFMGLSFMLSSLIPVSSMLANWFVKKQGLASSIVFAGIGLGGAVLSPIINFFISSGGWRTSRLYVIAIYFVLCIPSVLFLLKATPEEMGLKPYGAEEEKEQEEKDQQQEGKGHIKKEVLSYKEAQKKLFYSLFLVGSIFTGVACGGGMQHIGPFFNDLFNPAIASLAVFTHSLSAVFGKLFLGWLYDRYGNNVSLLFGGTMFFLAFSIMAFVKGNLYVLIFAAVLFGIGNSIGSVSNTLVTYSIFGRDSYLPAYAISKSVQQIGMASGPIVFALVQEAMKGYWLVWTLAAIVVVISTSSWLKSADLAKNMVITE